jgi:hypothetical protein
MSSESKKSTAVWVFLWIIAVAVTCVVAFLLYAESSRTDKFYLSLFVLVFAETLTFAHPVYLILRNEKGKNGLPFHFGTATIIGLYDVAVVFLVMVAHTNISYNFLLVAYLGSSLVLAILLGLSTIGSLAISKTDSKDARQRTPLITFRNEFALVCDRLTMIEDKNVEGLIKNFEHFRDESLEYATAESLPGSEDVDLEMNFCLQKIEDNVAQLEESAASNQNENIPDGGIASGNADKGQENPLIKNLDNQLKKMSVLLKRRETLIGQLR